MAKVFDVPADDLILRLSDQLKKDKKINPPEWDSYVKTWPHVEKIHQNRYWWYTRCASLVRKVYLHGPIGISDLKSYYGGRKRIGPCKYTFLTRDAHLVYHQSLFWGIFSTCGPV